MSMSQSSLKSSIKAAMLANIPSPTSDQLTGIDTTANALAAGFITCVSTLSIQYISGLVGVSTGSPIAGAVLVVNIS